MRIELVPAALASDHQHRDLVGVHEHFSSQTSADAHQCGSVLVDAAQNAQQGVGAVQTCGLEHGVRRMSTLLAHCTVVVIDALPNGNHLDHVIGFQEVAIHKAVGALTYD
jgi:hypothetical protein